MKTVTSISIKGFTLIELLIVVGILAILGTVVVIIINPTQMLTQTRDSRRLVELSSINKALQIAAVQGVASFGSSTTVYVSLPSNNPDCSDLGLPTLSGDWVYHCSNQTDYQKIDGNGWIPIAFNFINTGSPFPVLPIDPTNNPSTGLYYTYVTGGSWELTAVFETAKYQQQYAKNDGGQSDTAEEIGSHVGLSPSEIAKRYDCPVGPQTNYNLSKITNIGFTLCWSKTFGATGASVDAACTGNDLLLACRQVSTTTAAVAACGKRTVVLSKNITCLSGTPRPATDFPIDNNVRWYDNSCSFGWADTQATQINQNSCNYGVDSATGGVYGTTQMCRHGASTAPSSGYSCGNTILNGNNSWTLEVYQR